MGSNKVSVNKGHDNIIPGHGRNKGSVNKITAQSKKAINTLLSVPDSIKQEAAIKVWKNKPEIAFTIISKILPKNINITKTSINENRFLLLMQDLRQIKNNGSQ